MYHLRENIHLTVKVQDVYFNSVFASMFEQTHPGQFLFSYLENDTCIGYGGLVHIDCRCQHAEISFIINTRLENCFFALHWRTFLLLIEEFSFSELNLDNIFKYAYDLRPQLYKVLEDSCYTKEAVLKKHSSFNDSFVEVVIHSKFNKCFI